MATAAQAAEKTLRRAVDGGLPLAIGRITLAGGNVNFSDYFIRPNYSANLTQVAGTVSALSASQAGEVAITAKVDDAAPVTISGRIQPFARELTLSLAGRARDIESRRCRHTRRSTRATASPRASSRSTSTTPSPTASSTPATGWCSTS